jgi:hypothetical protein
MAHFAELDKNNIVVNVLYMPNDVITNENGVELEELGIYHLRKHNGKNKRWIQTSINETFRKNYAQIGFTYDESLDAFIPTKPEQFPSWVLNETTCKWEPPILKPVLTDNQIQYGCRYYWNEEQQQWIYFEPKLHIPTLTQEQIDRNCAYLWNDKLWESDNTKGWILFCPDEGLDL